MSNYPRHLSFRACRESFNPSVGILFCRTTVIEINATLVKDVSIPRSGFCFVEPEDIQITKTNLLEFQSLGRDSVLSNVTDICVICAVKSVSIPRSGFCFVEQSGEDTRRGLRSGVSIPRSGFCFVEPAKHPPLIWKPPHVSIPRSGFCFVERMNLDKCNRDKIVSIPRSGFCFVERKYSNRKKQQQKFQSLGRDSVLSNIPTPKSPKRTENVSIPRSGFCFVEPASAVASRRRKRSFNPSVGILFCRTNRHKPLALS